MAKPVFHEEIIYPLVQKGILEVDDQGRIWRTAVRKGDRWKLGEARLCPCKRRRAENSTGTRVYLQIRAMIAGKRYNAMAHRLVWRHFNGPIPEGMTVNHLNGAKTDNRPGNLELATPAEQMVHAYRTGLIDEHGERNPAAKLSNADVEKVREHYSKGQATQLELAKAMGVTHQTISKIVRGESRPKQTGSTADYTDRRFSRARTRDPWGRYAG